jgi:hypothetical protein
MFHVSDTAKIQHPLSDCIRLRYNLTISMFYKRDMLLETLRYDKFLEEIKFFSLMLYPSLIGPTVLFKLKISSQAVNLWYIS